MKPPESFAGRTCVVAHPFIREEVELPSDDPKCFEMVKVMSWRPGIRYELVGPWGDSEAVADGMGEQILTVISEHKPGRYPTRIFYTRQWRSPDGKLFGRAALRIKVRGAFKTLISGYQVEFRLKPNAEAA